MGVIVGVGGAFGSIKLGFKGFITDCGKRKIITKYTPTQNVRISVTILNISQISSFELCFGAGVSS
jgi:hypothetical protein